MCEAGEAGEAHASASIRARPLSGGGGLWTLFSWLRREASSGSSSSLSSAGSDRTVASFAFLAPLPRHHRASSTPDPTPTPHTDTYKSRVTERSRHADLNLTLHRKYGLYKDNSYDGFSLRCARRNINGTVSVDRQDRDRRATSECYQLRAAHVPGKRRAPLPPAQQTASLPRRNTRKRRAPPPPIYIPRSMAESNQQSKSSAVQKDKHTIQNIAENSTRTDFFSTTNSKEPSIKHRNEKSFLKQLFDIKKRNSTIDPSPGKILPSISELDRQAAELIKSCKLKRDDLSENGTLSVTWLCMKCLRKYDSSVVVCLNCDITQKHLKQELGNKDTNATNIYTQTENAKPLVATTSENHNGIGSDEKQKLKEMLKEMKDSLPKRPKRDISEDNQHKIPHNTDNHSVKENKVSLETPTLRIGLTVADKDNNKTPVPSSSKFSNNSIIMSNISKENIKETGQSNNVNIEKPKISTKHENVQMLGNNDGDGNTGINLHIPLKVSTLLNPVYIPKSEHTEPLIRPILVTPETRDVSKNLITPFNKAEKNTQASSSNITPEIKAMKTQGFASKLENKYLIDQNKNQFPNGTVSNIVRLPTASKNGSINKVAPSNVEPSKVAECKSPLDQHSKRRDLINQLEKSIANGDERAAAEAAVKLAQLRLSCSVLSFSSQIAGSSKTNVTDSVNAIKENYKNKQLNSSQKVDVGVKSMASVIQKKTNSNEKVSETNSKVINKPTETEKLEVNTPSTAALPSTSNQFEPNNSIVPIEVWVEDREATRGPIRLRIARQAVMGDLRRQAEISLGLPARLQRWIIGRTLSNDDGTPLKSLAGPHLSAPFYLCIVEAGTSGTTSSAVLKVDKNDKKKETQPHGRTSVVYTELMQLEQQSLVPNAEPFECGVCMEECAIGAGVVIRECVHSFCKDCLADLIRHCEEPVVSCPAVGCTGILQEREIRTITTPEEYERWLARGLAAAESGTRNAFHCRTRDCTGWALCDSGVRRFPCPVCKHINCLRCEAIHEGETCEQYRTKMEEANKSTESGLTETDEGTQALLDNLITKGEALKCPECNAIITKKWGCDWVKCSACKTEICWVTRGRRWGPAGRGDTSAGCRCGLDGKRCHPSCGYCH